MSSASSGNPGLNLRSNEFTQNKPAAFNTYVLAGIESDLEQVRISSLSEDSIFFSKSVTHREVRIIRLLEGSQFRSKVVSLKYSYRLLGEMRSVKWLSLLSLGPSGTMESLEKLDKQEKGFADFVTGSAKFSLRDKDLKATLALAIQLPTSPLDIEVLDVQITDSAESILADLAGIFHSKTGVVKAASGKKATTKKPALSAAPANRTGSPPISKPRVADTTTALPKHLVIREPLDLQLPNYPDEKLVVALPPIAAKLKKGQSKDLVRLVQLHEAARLEWESLIRQTQGEIDGLRVALDEAYSELTRLKQVTPA